MEPHVADLIDALPQDVEGSESPPTSAAVSGLLQKPAPRAVPIGRWNRARIFGTLQAKIAAAYFAYWIRGGYQGVDEQQQRKNETHLRAALEVLSSMTYMRGAVMKIGQMIANYPLVAPEEFVGVLERLHFEAPPMHFSLLREFVRKELGNDPERIFDDFEPHAFAAASLGQVHRARLKGSGQEVAIKIQYPNIGRTIRDDLRNFRAALLPMRFSGDWDNIKLQFDDIRRMLEMETDYEHEAANLETARGAFSEDEGIVVPKVFREFSTRRVLTMEHISGVHMPEFMASEPSQEVRDAFGDKILRSAARLWYGKHVLYADPHPGNYFFMPDGRLGLVDFGCCYQFTAADLQYVDAVERAVHTSREALREALVIGTNMTPQQREEPERMALLEQVSDWLWEPLLHQGRFDFGNPDYFRRGVDLFGEVMRNRYYRAMPVNIWLDRNFMGLRALMYKLKARVEWGPILRSETTVEPVEVES